jgi:hypothetical protein
MLARNGYFTYATMRDIQKSKEIERIAQQENLPILPTSSHLLIYSRSLQCLGSVWTEFYDL